MNRDRIRKLLSKTPVLWRFKDNFSPKFPGSPSYWNSRYQAGCNSGVGSYGHLAQFKADVLNGFVADCGAKTVLEFGCGDGAQAALARYPAYIGLDVSPTAIKLCLARFLEDRSKSFFLYAGDCFIDHQKLFSADLVLSLDVIYHLIEDEIFERYMRNMFEAARRFVIIYSSNHDEVISNTHVRHRKFSDYAAKHFSDFSLIDRINQRYPMATHGDQGSFADFYIYEKKS